MGQIFYACAFDIENKTCSVVAADKFHSNCYAHSGTVLSIHYLLRQKPYHVMWGGDYMAIDDNVEEILRTEELLGISTYMCYDDFEMNNAKSKSFNSRYADRTIDLIPVLTETGGGTPMALYDGVSADSREELSCQWCGDLL